MDPTGSLAFGGRQLTIPAQGHNPGQQAGEACGSQRSVALAHHPAQPLDGRCRVMADAVNGEEDVIRTANEAGEQSGAVLDTAVVMQKMRACALRQSLELRDLASPPAHVQQDGA